MACSRLAATLLELTGDDILVQRGAARWREERAAIAGMRAIARREAIFPLNRQRMESDEDK